jgi:hypothetical protein
MYLIPIHFLVKTFVLYSEYFDAMFTQLRLRHAADFFSIILCRTITRLDPTQTTFAYKKFMIQIELKIFPEHRSIKESFLN